MARLFASRIEKAMRRLERLAQAAHEDDLGAHHNVDMPTLYNKASDMLNDLLDLLPKMKQNMRDHVVQVFKHPGDVNYDALFAAYEAALHDALYTLLDIYDVEEFADTDKYSSYPESYYD